METVPSIQAPGVLKASPARRNETRAPASAADAVDRYRHQEEPANITYTAEKVRQQYASAAGAKLPAPPSAELQTRLNESETRELQRMEARDRLVRTHEGRHAAALGAYAGAIHYNYQVGPDGRLYALGGYTEVNTMPSATPEATAAKARIIRNAALAPGAISGTDFMVATHAAHMERMAMASVLRSE